MYIKIKYRFWSAQPVFHIYDFHYWLFSPDYINKSLPEKNKFTNFKNIIKTYLPFKIFIFISITKQLNS